MDLTIQEKVKEMALATVTTLGLQLVEVTITERNRLYTIEVLADRMMGGISLDECANINKQLSEALELSQIVAEDYELVVASPGLDRPLKDEQDFRRVLGIPVRFVLTEKVEEKGEYSGKVLEVLNGYVLVKTSKREIKIPLNKIMKAVQII